MLVNGYNLQNKTVLEIGKFSILWNCFEHDWCSNNCNPDKIKSIVKSIQFDREKQSQFAKVLNNRRNWFGQLEIDYVRESLHPGSARASKEDDIQIMRQFLEQEGDDFDLICGCLLVIYRIRNNLMHGLKLIEELDGQIELFRAANDVLESIGG